MSTCKQRRIAISTTWTTDSIPVYTKESNMAPLVLVFLLSSCVTLSHVCQGASIQKRQAPRRGPFDCPAIDCPWDMSGCAEGERLDMITKMFGEHCCALCDRCVPINGPGARECTLPGEETARPEGIGGSGASGGIGTTGLRPIPDVMPMLPDLPVHGDENDTKDATPPTKPTPPPTKPSPPASVGTKSTYRFFEATNMISSMAPTAPVKEGLERHTLHTLKSLGQQFLALFRKQEEAGLTGSAVVPGGLGLSGQLPDDLLVGQEGHILHKLDDVGTGGSGVAAAILDDATRDASADAASKGSGGGDSNPGAGAAGTDAASTEESTTDESTDDGASDPSSSSDGSKKTFHSGGPDDQGSEGSEGSEPGGPPDDVPSHDLSLEECHRPTCPELPCTLWFQKQTFYPDPRTGNLCPGCPTC